MNSRPEEASPARSEMPVRRRASPADERSVQLEDEESAEWANLLESLSDPTSELWQEESDSAWYSADSRTEEYVGEEWDYADGAWVSDSGERWDFWTWYNYQAGGPELEWDESWTQLASSDSEPVSR